MFAVRVLCLVAAACSSAGHAEPDPRPRCTGAAEKTVGATLAQRAVAAPMAKTPEGQKAMAELAPRMVATLTGLCVEDHWPDATTRCFASDPDTLRCRDLLSPEQRGHYTTAMMEVMQVMTLAADSRTTAARSANR